MAWEKEVRENTEENDVTLQEEIMNNVDRKYSSNPAVTLKLLHHL